MLALSLWRRSTAAAQMLREEKRGRRGATAKCVFPFADHPLFSCGGVPFVAISPIREGDAITGDPRRREEGGK